MNDTTCSPGVTTPSGGYVSGGACTIQIDTDALEVSSKYCEKTEERLAQAVSSIKLMRMRLGADWSLVSHKAQLRDERVLAQDCQIIEERPNAQDFDRKAALLQQLDEVEDRINKAKPRMEQLGEIAFKAVIEYKSADRLPTFGAATLMLLSTPTRRVWQMIGTVPLVLIANEVRDPVQRSKLTYAASREGMVQIAEYSDKATFTFFKGLLSGDKQFSLIEHVQRAVFLENEATRSLFALRTSHLLTGLVKELPQTYVPVTQALLIKPATGHAQSTISKNIEWFDEQNKKTPGGVQITKTIENGVARYVVNIPGTTEWTPDAKNHPLDLSSNIESMYHDDSTGTEYVLAAMEAAGIKAGDDVVLMGHSQGGIVASALASRHDFVNRFKVRGVVTMNSPTAHNKILPGIPTLHIENKPDAVTSLDAKEVPVTKDRVQLVGTAPKESVHNPHDVLSSKVILDANRGQPSVDKVVSEIEKYLPKEGWQTSAKIYDIVRK